MTIASIDIGTNTVLLLIAKVDTNTKEFYPLLNIQRIPRIGKGLKHGHPIAEEKILKLFEVLDEYKKLIKENDCEKVLVTATNAFRIASNGNEIAEKISKKYNFSVKIVTGDEEARLSLLGVTDNISRDKQVLVIDIGGGSTELISEKNLKINFQKSFSIGVVSHTEKFLLHDPPEEIEIRKLSNEIDLIFKEILILNLKPDEGIAIAGTPTTLACIKNNLDYFDEEKIEGSKLNQFELEDMVNELSLLSSKKIKEKYKSIVENREDILFTGSLILLKLMKLLYLNEVIVSTKGIRYGTIVDYLNKL